MVLKFHAKKYKTICQNVSMAVTNLVGDSIYFLDQFFNPFLKKIWYIWKPVSCFQVVVGACGAGRYADCPGKTWHEILCCPLPGFYFGHCFEYGTEHGKPNSCLDHGEIPTLLEGTCGSGAELDCDGYSVINSCCEGHLATTGENVGPNDRHCSWTYANHGYPLECGREDEIVAGRCGSGQIARCPNDSSHGILCCELVVLE